MRHQQFIARTITQRPFPTVGPGLAEGLASASEPVQGSDHRSLDTHVHRPPLQRHAHTVVTEHTSTPIVLLPGQLRQCLFPPSLVASCVCS